MLDAETKRRIDACRDILVGKVPDPKSQVEHITIALIYKFMDDMDTEAEELGGVRSFFSHDYAQYGWAKLMRTGLGGQEMLNLYAEAIAKMPENPGIPVLFRDIFKNAYLPYRDPETLRSFLKEINAFTYDHSEKLGDAFEYLLSVLGSQGDAGQFRTPRHIIDFMVAVMNPQKHESILDPACGTAGFLISAWKHILNSNTSPRPLGAGGRAGDQLTPDERSHLAANIHGYDISPDMVRLSLVNLYLHGFSQPHVLEYDTLTSEEKWNETADVILANPPFMSPKGGIKPHKRFSIQASRSEVLFVDYIAEHLSPTGRAAIVVPEGIIFQSQTAYKSLRKLLVEKYLVAVISLPAGVFNPYSGVKTSILILDKRLAKTSDRLAFFKVENDGYGLGAQRRAIDKNDLPPVKAELDMYLNALRSQQPTAELQLTRGLIVTKEKVAANGDYNLSGERYRDAVANLSSFPLVPLEEIFKKIGNGVNVTQVDEAAKYRVSRIQTIADGSVNLEKTKFTNDEVKPESFLNMGDILLSHINSFDHLGKTAIFLEHATDVIHGINLIRLVPETSLIDPRFAIRVFKTDRFINTVKSFAQKAVNQASVKTSDLRAIQIPLPPLEVQKEIVAEIEGYQKVIDGARAVLDHYRPHIPIHPDWPMVELSELIKLSSGEFLTAAMKKDGSYPVYGGNGINGTHDEYLFEFPTVVIGRVGAYCGAVHLTEPKAWITDNGLYVKELLKPVDLKFLEQSLRSLNLNQYAKVGGQPSISQSIVLERKIALPELETQQAIVAEIEAEQALVAANRELIARFEQKIQTTLARVWGAA